MLVALSLFLSRIVSYPSLIRSLRDYGKFVSFALATNPFHEAHQSNQVHYICQLREMRPFSSDQHTNTHRTIWVSYSCFKLYLCTCGIWWATREIRSEYFESDIFCLHVLKCEIICVVAFVIVDIVWSHFYSQLKYFTSECCIPIIKSHPTWIHVKICFGFGW